MKLTYPGGIMNIDVAGLVRAIQDDPEQRALLRTALLGDGPDLHAALTRLADAQARTEARIDELAQAQARTEARVDELAQAQVRTEARLDALAKDVRELAAAQQRTEAALNALVDVVAGMNDRLARLHGESFERRCREKGHAYFQRIARRLRPLDPAELSEAIDDARIDGRLNDAEVESLLRVDAVFVGRDRDEGEPIHLAVEASVTLGRSDVRRARERAELLARVVGTPVIGVVVAEYAPPPVMVAAQDAEVWQVVGGRTLHPHDDLDVDEI